MLRVDHDFKAMGGPCRLRFYARDEAHSAQAVAAAIDEIERLENKYSRYRDDSLTSRINRAAGTAQPIPLDAETAGLLDYADTLWRESGGLFDLTSGILRRAWDFRSGRIPSDSELQALLPLVGWDKVERDAQGIALPGQGMEIDFGGLVKEYAADSVANRLRECGVSRALVDLAGDMAVVGPPVGEEGWPVGIRHPAQPEQAIAAIALSGGALASSGDYERCIDIDGERYGHILHPGTGWPVRGLVAVSILAPQCLVAGSSATVAMLQPAAQALDWLAALGLPWLAVDAQLNCHGTIATATG